MWVREGVGGGGVGVKWEGREVVRWGEEGCDKNTPKNLLNTPMTK